MLVMKYQIVDVEGYVYGEFPTNICAMLALTGMSTMIDGLVIKTIL